MAEILEEALKKLPAPPITINDLFNVFGEEIKSCILTDKDILEYRQSNTTLEVLTETIITTYELNYESKKKEIIFKKKSVDCTKIIESMINDYCALHLRKTWDHFINLHVRKYLDHTVKVTKVMILSFLESKDEEDVELSKKILKLYTWEKEENAKKKKAAKNIMDIHCFLSGTPHAIEESQMQEVLFICLSHVHLNDQRQKKILRALVEYLKIKKIPLSS